MGKKALTERLFVRGYFLSGQTEVVQNKHGANVKIIIDIRSKSLLKTPKGPLPASLY